MPLTIWGTRSASLRRTAGEQLLTLTSSVARTGMMLQAVPSLKAPTVTTAASMRSMLRATMVCSAVTTAAPATIGSTMEILADGAKDRGMGHNPLVNTHIFQFLTLFL